MICTDNGHRLQEGRLSMVYKTASLSFTVTGILGVDDAGAGAVMASIEDFLDLMNCRDRSGCCHAHSN